MVAGQDPKIVTSTAPPGAMDRSSGAGLRNSTSLRSEISAFCAAEMVSSGSATTSCQLVIAVLLWLTTVTWPVNWPPDPGVTL